MEGLSIGEETRCYPNINRFYLVCDSHSLSPNEGFVPNSALLSIKTTFTNR